MQELTDDQLDGLFRKLSGESEPPYDPAAWQAMQRKLDTHDQTRLTPTPFWEHLIRWGLPVLLLLLLTVGGWKVYQLRSAVSKQPERATLRPNELATIPDISGSEANVADKQHRMVSPTDVPAPERGGNGSAAPERPALRRAAPIVPPTSRATWPTIRNSVGSAAPKPERNGATRRSRTGNTERNVLVAPISANRTIVERPLRSVEPQRDDATKPSGLLRSTAPGVLATSREERLPVAANRSETREGATVQVEQSDNGATGQPSIVENQESSTRLLLTVDEIPIKPVLTQSLFPVLTRAVTYQPDPPMEEAPALVQQPILPERGLSVRFVVSPDLSAIGLRNFARPGINVGMLLEYRLASRWSLQTGMLWSRKVYEAYTDQYVWPLPYPWKVMPEGVTGRCDMLDIPINVRYDVAVRSHGRWFASGGATSYIITREEYNFNYANPNDPNIGPNNWQRLINNTSRYGFSQMNFSVGYERLISKRLSLQVEPFMKASLRRVGYYQVHLLSTGVFFSLRYQLWPTSVPKRTGF